MSFVKKTKEFFGLEPTELGYEDDAYYAEEPRYTGAVAYERSYEPERTYQTAIVPVTVTSYADAVKIGEPFRDGDAVIFDLSNLSNDDAKRLIDFTAGLCFALRGTFKKLDNRVFGLMPENSTVYPADLERALQRR